MIRDVQLCTRALFSRDRGETETKAFRARDRAEALLHLETAARQRRQDRGHIPANYYPHNDDYEHLGLRHG